MKFDYRLTIQKCLGMLTVALGAMLALGVLGCVVLYVVWGSVILNKDVDAEGGNYCDDEHIWVYVLFCVILVACGLCCGIGLCNQAVCRRNAEGQYQPGMFPVITATVALGVFAWGLLQYLLISGACRNALKGAYPDLWTFFFVSFVIQAFGAVLQIVFFIVLCFLPDKAVKEPEESLDQSDTFFNESISSADLKLLVLPKNQNFRDTLPESSHYLIGLSNPHIELSDEDENGFHM